LISLKHGFLFIHIPKTAGNSIQNVLKEYSEEKVVSIAPHQDGVERFEVRSDDYTIQKHSTLWDYQQQLGSDVIDRLFKFTCVRNPWDRMISFYFSPHRGAVSWDREKFIALVNEVKPGMNFVSSEDSAVTGKESFKNMDFYIRFEELDEGFKDVCQRIEIPSIPLNQRNVSNHKHYSSYYDAESLELVRERFCEEINFFGFKFKSTHI